MYIQRLWETYQEMVLPKDASPTQVTETRQAFFAGASSLFTMMTGQSFFSESEDPTGMDEAKMYQLQMEINEFGRRLDAKYGILQPGSTREQ